jgi:putative MFS transporter
MAAAFGRIGGILGPLMVGALVAREVSMTGIFTIFCLSIIIGIVFLAVLGKETKRFKMAGRFQL